jgi:hypothetical protein
LRKPSEILNEQRILSLSPRLILSRFSYSIPFFFLFSGSKYFGPNQAHGQNQRQGQSKFKASKNQFLGGCRKNRKTNSKFISGAFFICNPYCEVVSVKEGDTWRPKLTQVKLVSDKIVLMAKDDPLYLALFPEKPEELPAPPPQEGEAKSLTPEMPGPTEVEVPANVPDRPAEPKPPWVPFEHGLRMSFGFQNKGLNQSSDSNVQSAFSKESNVLSTPLGVAYLMAKPRLFLSKWWQLEMAYLFDLYVRPVRLTNSASMKNTKNALTFIAWIKEPKFSWGPKLGFITDQFEVDENTLNSFSFSEETTQLGLIFKYRRFIFSFGYGLKFNLIEQQPFRDKLREAVLYNFEAESCLSHRRYRGIFITPCYGLKYQQNNNSATLAPAINPAGTVTLKRSEISALLTVYFGEDFLR